MNSLVDEMVHDDPSKRPTMDQVVECFDRIRKSLTGHKLRSRLADLEEGTVSTVLRNFIHLRKRIVYMISRLPPIPSLDC